ncbi:MAG: AMP-binding protein [Actinomycetales bacterium]|nr:AMP-binding protein [Actinomycetales bacterium]
MSSEHREDVGLFTWLRDVAAHDPAREILIEHVEDRFVTTAAGDLFDAASRVANGLSRLGLSTGDSIALWLPNRAEWFVTEFACAALGVTILGLNTRFKSHEVSHLFRTVDVAAVVLPDSFLGIDFVATLSSAIADIRETDPHFDAPRLVVAGAVADSHFTIDPSAVAMSDLAIAEPLQRFDDHGLILSNLFTTSGSTSAPKVAGHDQASIVRHAKAGARALGVRPGDRILAALPMCGVFGFSSVMALLVGGGAAVLMSSFDAAEAARLLKAANVTHVVGGDEMLGAAFSAVADDDDLPSLRRGGIANFAGHARDVVESADQRWGAKISGVYGSSELFALSAIWPAEADIDRRVLGGGVTVDPGIEVRIADLETGEPVADGQPGELQFRGYNTITAYLNNPAATQKSFTSDGWFRTGDLGYFDAGGFVYQCRAREALRLRGFLVEPGEIEEYFSAQPGVEEVHVVGIDTDDGTKAVAFIQMRDDATFDETTLLASAKRELANYKVPTRAVRVEEFPTTTGTNGTKVRFEELREVGRSLLA